MNPVERPFGLAVGSLARSPWLRDLAARRDRVPADERADMPEIEEAYRVSFSDAVRTTDAPPLRADRQAQDARLRSYRDIASL